MNNNWLLLRGLTREAGHWGDFVTQMQCAFPDAQINTLDLSGSGAYYQETSPDSIAEITQLLRQHALEKGYLQSKPRLLTLSLGGMVAWEWMQQYPDDIHSAVLMNSSLATVNPFYQRLRWQSYGKLAAIVCQSDCYQQELAIVKLVSNLAAQHENVAVEWDNIQRSRPVSKQNALRQIIAAAKYAPALDKPIPPVLLLNGLGDRLVSPACSESISKRWSLPLISHPWAGHDLCLDDAAWVIEQLREWCEKN
ncbi:MAG: alpha/beta hydrolase [Methylococcales bacterium]|nr:alpha/beta hydrolase [Methylococcales bacterium]